MRNALEIIGNNAKFNEELRKYIATLGIETDDCVIVDIYHKLSENDRMQDYRGIEVAYGLAIAGKPVILHGFATEQHLRHKSNKFLTMMLMPNVMYLRFPFAKDELETAFETVQKGEARSNEAARLAGELREKDHAAAKLLHVLPHISEGTTRFTVWCEEARAAGFAGETEADVLANVVGWKRQTQGAFSGRRFGGSFVDIQGTLVTDEGQLSAAIVTLIQDRLDDGVPVTLWTDGDLREMEKLVRGLGIDLPVVSKFDFHGATVAEAIDDFAAGVFTERYGIIAERFICVGDLSA